MRENENYAIENGYGKQLAAGISLREAYRTAARLADQRNESMFIYATPFDENAKSIEVEPSEIEVELNSPVGPRITYGEQPVEDIEAEIPEGWRVDWSSSQLISPPFNGTVRYSALLFRAATKSDVFRWESVAGYVVLCPGYTHDVPIDVRVEVGEAGGRWYVRTDDDGGGSDEVGDESYSTEAEAVAAAEEWASDHDEGGGESAADYQLTQLVARAGTPAPKGSYAVYWATVGDDEHVVERYATRDAAEAACQIANRQLHEAHPGGRLLCGYEVRVRVNGEWVGPDDEDQD